MNNQSNQTQAEKFDVSANLFKVEKQGAQNQQLSASQLMIFVVCWLGGICAGMAANLFNLMLPHAMQELGNTLDRTIVSQLGSHILFIFLLGWTTGGIVIGMISDRYGRVKAMFLSITLYAIFTGISSLVTAPWQLAICRFFTGIGIGGEMVCISVILAECWPSRSRAVAIGALITSYQVGVFLSGIVCNLFQDWRSAFAFGTLPIVLAILIPFIMKESEKWKNNRLLQKQNGSFARKSKLGILDPFKQIFSAEQRKNLLIGSLAFGTLLVGYWASVAWIPTWIQDLIEGEMGQEKNIATIYHGLAAVIGCVIAGPFANRFGRIPTIIISFAGAFFTSIGMFWSNETFTSAIYWQNGLLGLFIGMAQAIMYIYLPELFPTAIRATAVGFCLNLGRIATAIAVLFIGLLVPFLGGYSQALITFACLYLIGASAIAFARETKAKALPD